MKNLKSEKGFTLLEVIVAISILSIGILAVASMQIMSLKGDAFAQSRTESATWAQDKMEELLSLPYDHPNLTVGSSYSDETRGNYLIRYTVENNAVSNTKLLTVSVRLRGKVVNQISCIRSQLLV
jgi:type IV pilus assembly protein PilV